ncbi:MAG TPA: proline dehydrogenase family protein [Candidatus Bathyarchaeia archaeon]|nr:proline dehydrogenase family protein [Candidatus Bathyarchaeia archaeon]
MTGITERLFYRIAKRWIAGYTMEDAVKSAHEANERKTRVILNRLGEHTPDRKLIEGYSQEYLRLVDAIHDEKIQGTISIKPSQLGLAIEEPLFRSLITPILEKASDLGQFVWIDMENSPYTESTVSTYRDLLGSHKELGMCLQANMRRTESDLAKLLPLGGKIRLVKGAYPENREVAFKRRSEIDANFVRLLNILFEQSDFFAVGTHDGKLVDEAKSLNKDHKANFEFQLLKGIRDELKTSLLADGFRVSEYIPYGPEWYNYSKRRLRERKRNILLFVRSVTG